MDEIKNNCVYYNAPTLSENIYTPVSVVGIALVEKDDTRPYLEIIVRRDRNVQLSSFTVAYRYTCAPIAKSDETNRFRKIMYNKDDINSKDYLIIRCAVPPEGLQNGVSAVVSSATTEDGKMTMFRQRDFVDPDRANAGNGEGADSQLAQYLSHRSASFMKKLSGGYETEWIDDGCFGEVAETNDAPSEVINYRVKKAVKNCIIGIVVTVLIIGALAVGAILLINKFTPQNTAVADLPILLKGKQYAEAYKIASESDDKVQLQEICRQASAYYLDRNDYENAYLFAYAAPTPFDEEIVEVFAEELLKEGRFDEAYEFAKAHGNYEKVIQKVCNSAVEKHLESNNYIKAYFFAEEAPESLAGHVIGNLSAYLREGGRVNVETFAILDSMEDSEEYNSLALAEISKFANENDYVSAVNIANKVRDEAVRVMMIKDMCSTGAAYYMEHEMLIEAATVIEDSADVLGEDWKPIVQTMVNYCIDNDINSGAVYFGNLLGNDTSNIVIEREELYLRNSVSKVYFLLTEAQKRAYHANPFDLYKEAYLIKDGVLVGTQITNAVSVATSEFFTVVLLSDGTVTSWSNNGHNRTPDIPSAVNIVQIDAGRDHYVLLHDSGKVYAYGDNTYGQCGVRQWKDVVKVVAGADFTVGLCADGTLRACGSNMSGQCDVDRFTNVVDITACDQTLFVLFADGTVKAVGDVSLGLKKADSFTDVRSIQAAGNTVVAEKNDGTFLMASGSIGGDCGDVDDWENVELFSAGAVCVGYVNEDGDIIIKGDGAPVNNSGN